MINCLFARNHSGLVGKEQGVEEGRQLKSPGPEGDSVSQDGEERTA